MHVKGSVVDSPRSSALSFAAAYPTIVVENSAVVATLGHGIVEGTGAAAWGVAVREVAVVGVRAGHVGARHVAVPAALHLATMAVHVESVVVAGSEGYGMFAK